MEEDILLLLMLVITIGEGGVHLEATRLLMPSASDSTAFRKQWETRSVLLCFDLPYAYKALADLLKSQPWQRLVLSIKLIGSANM